jgi:hypothetical protein
MHGREKSESAIVAVKPTNKAVPTGAEPEPRAGAKGNARQIRVGSQPQDRQGSRPALSDSVALIAGMWNVERTLDGNTAVVGPLRISAVLQKRNDRWLVVHFAIDGADPRTDARCRWHDCTLRDATRSGRRTGPRFTSVPARLGSAHAASSGDDDP